MDDRQRRPTVPLIPAHARRPSAITAVVCAAVTIVLGVLYWRSSQPGPVNRSVDPFLIRHLGSHYHALTLVHDLGQPVEVTIIVAVIALACLAVRRLNGALLAVIGLVVASGLTEKVLKPLFERTLDGSQDYPSGHTCATFALATIITVILLNPPSGRPRRAVRITVAVIGALAGCAVAVAMTSLGYHYFTDTIGGAATGIGVVLATAFALDLPRVRRLLPAASFRPRLARERDRVGRP